MVAGLRQQVAWRDPEAVCDPTNHHQAGLTLGSLDEPDLGESNSSGVSHLLLSQVACQAQFPYALAECPHPISVCRGLAAQQRSSSTSLFRR